MADVVDKNTNGTEQYSPPISSSRDLLGRVGVVCLLLLALICYLGLGAICFSTLERTTEEIRWEEGKLAIEQLVKDLLPEESEEEMILERTANLTAVIRRLADDGNPYIYERRENAWSYLGGLYVAVSTVTTIGYGNIYPVTMGGQMFLVVFSLIGIPLCFMFIGYLGALLASSAEFAFNLRRQERSRSSFMVTILLVSLGLVLAELLIFSVWIKYGLDKRMSFWDSFYFAFVSFTTIGFGNHGFYNGDNGNIGKVMFTLLIVILCLAPLALYINLVVRDVMTAASPFLARMGVTEPADPETEMISKTKEYQGEYGATDAMTE